MGEHSFSQISSFFSLNLQHRPSGSASLCAWPLPYLVAYQHPCHTVPSYTLPSAWVSYPDHRAKKEGGEEKKEKWCHTAMTPERWMEERWKEREYREKEGGKRRQRSHGSSVTGGRSRERQATLPALLQPLLHPIPVPVPLHVQKQQSLRETHTQTRLFSITLSSWAGYIRMPLLAATSFSGVQHCRVWVVAV